GSEPERGSGSGSELEGGSGAGSRPEGGPASESGAGGVTCPACQLPGRTHIGVLTGAAFSADPMVLAGSRWRRCHEPGLAIVSCFRGNDSALGSVTGWSCGAGRAAGLHGRISVAAGALRNNIHAVCDPGS